MEVEGGGEAMQGEKEKESRRESGYGLYGDRVYAKDLREEKEAEKTVTITAETEEEFERVVVRFSLSKTLNASFALSVKPFWMTDQTALY